MPLRITAAVVSLIFAGAGAAAQENVMDQMSAKAAPAPLVAEEFAVPTLVEAEGFKLQPLGPELVAVDFAAYMSSIEHLQQTFSRSTSWPHADITAEEAMADMENEAARFKARTSFAYGVLTPDGTRERGSLYVSRSPISGYDAMVRMWVTKADFDEGFDDELYEWAKAWIAAQWPFANVAYPGRAITWEEWDALNKPRAQD